MSEHPMIQSVQRAVQFLEAEIRQERVPTLQAVAEASGLSKFHFHRVYRLVTGETLAQTTTRLRLARGTAMLQKAGAGVTEAAFVAGYASSQAFAKAMQRELAHSASMLRADPERLAQSIRNLSAPPTSIAADVPPPVRVEIGSLEPFEILLTRTTDQYPDLASTYWSLVEAIGDPQRIEAFIGVPHRDVDTFEDGDFVFDSAVKVETMPSSLPAGIQSQTVCGGDYLIVRHTGSDDGLSQTLDALYAFALGQPDLLFADAPCLHHYVDDPEVVDPALCRTDIYLRLNAAPGT